MKTDGDRTGSRKNLFPFSHHLHLCYISSSWSIIFGMLSLTGNFLPVSGHTKYPSTKYISNSTRCKLAMTASSKFDKASLSDTSNSSGNSGNGGSQCGLICCISFSNAEYCTLGNRLSRNCLSTGDSSHRRVVTSIFSGYPFSVLNIVVYDNKKMTWETHWLGQCHETYRHRCQRKATRHH